MTLWPIEDGRGIDVPGVGRTAVIPLTGNRPALGDPPFFDPIDPADVDVFAYDWSQISFAADHIIAATVTAEPPLLAISVPVVSGTLVQVIIGPMATVTETFDINCSVQFATGRVLDWGCEIFVRTL